MDYFVGLDIGTNSVGWAVTDEQYNVVKRHGKALWGVRCFDEANKAEKRRGFRVSRRRLDRRNRRMAWLRQEFSEEIAKVDPAFYRRLDESKFLEEDKQDAPDGSTLGKYALFADPDYTDKTYHSQYPTIYHLRKALMEEDSPFDVRLVFLAILHIFKKRGHFLIEGSMEQSTPECPIEELQDYLTQNYDVDFCVSDRAAFEKALAMKGKNSERLKALLSSCTGIDKKHVQAYAVINLLAGYKSYPCDLFGLQSEKKEEKSFSIYGDYDTLCESLSAIQDADFELLDRIRRVADWATLKQLLGDNSDGSISKAKVNAYEKHGEDLKRLKALFREDNQAYAKMFRNDDEKANYPAYSGHGASKRCGYDEFSNFAQGEIKKLKDKLSEDQKEEADKILDELECKTFLPLQSIRDNGVLPYQLHEMELKRILEKASVYLPFLNEADETGLTRRERILQVFSFRVPYYVGPLGSNAQNRQPGWVVRRSQDAVMPWNFETVIDVPKSAEAFIKRMTATCSYLGKPVLPRNSLLYEKFTVLNALSNICINGIRLTSEKKKRLYTEHVEAKGRCTQKSIANFLLSENLLSKNDDLSGLDAGFKLDMPGTRMFRRILERGVDPKRVEDVIAHVVLFGADQKLLKSWLKENCSDFLSEEDQKYVVKNRGSLSGWGNLSREFLEDIKGGKSEGKVYSVIDALMKTKCNLMELLSSDYTFAQAVEDYRRKEYGDQPRTLEDILEESYASPGIRRAIRQTMGILDEIQSILGGEPKRVFMEVTRSEGEKGKRTASRKMQLENLYEKCKSKDDEYKRLREALEGSDEGTLRSKKLYLYFTQMGKCMYSGRPIDLERLATGDYDIDHIYPQCRVKDNSFDNMVLVEANENRNKSDKYPLKEEVRTRMRAFWKMLWEKNFISEKKYRRLTRVTDFREEEKAGFIARQLVETSQACKVVGTVLKERYGAGRVVYVKAGNVSDFRQDQCLLPDGTQVQASTCKGNGNLKQDPVFVKVREVNDLHHAKDAYLNIVVGNVYHVKFTRNPLNFIRENDKYSMNHVFSYDVQRGGERAWTAGQDGSIATVRNMMRKNNILVTKLAHVENGKLFDLNILKKGNGQVSIKANDERLKIENFGGYNSRKSAFFILVESGSAKKRLRSIETVYLMDRKRYERDAVEYCKNVLKLEDPRVLIPEIKCGALMSYDGFRLYLLGRQTTDILLRNANQLILSPEENQYIKIVSKYVADCVVAKAAKSGIPTPSKGITEAGNCALYQAFMKKLENGRYSVKRGTIAKKLSSRYEDFTQLSIAEQSSVLMEILKLFRTAYDSANLTALGGAKRAGILTSSKDLNKGETHEWKLIHQSITGFYEQEVDLLKEPF